MLSATQLAGRVGGSLWRPCPPCQLCPRGTCHGRTCPGRIRQGIVTGLERLPVCSAPGVFPLLWAARHFYPRRKRNHKGALAVHAEQAAPTRGTNAACVAGGSLLRPARAPLQTGHFRIAGFRLASTEAARVQGHTQERERDVDFQRSPQHGQTTCLRIVPRVSSPLCGLAAVGLGAGSPVGEGKTLSARGREKGPGSWPLLGQGLQSQNEAGGLRGVSGVCFSLQRQGGPVGTSTPASRPR